MAVRAFLFSSSFYNKADPARTEPFGPSARIGLMEARLICRLIIFRFSWLVC